jgi:hypothetical protein
MLALADVGDGRHRVEPEEEVPATLDYIVGAVGG